jgi:hypothetical protein
MPAPGSEKLVKAGFVVLDATGVVLKIVVFQYNPETLLRRLEAGIAPPPPSPPIVPAPQEMVNFTMSLDAADKLETGDQLTQQRGLLPVIAALELLLYPPPGTLTVWVSGARRILPVRITELVFNEQMFDPALNPIRARVSVSLQVLKDADLTSNSRGRAIWDAHYTTLQQLAQAFGNGRLSALGITGV